ncbi:hypothetical protein UlMin_043608 [Ulmus minor]
MARGGTEKREEVVAVAIDKDKSSQYALKWTVDHLITRGQSITLLHVKNKTSSVPNPFGNYVSMNEVGEDVARTYRQQLENQAKDLFLPFRCFCTRKDIKCNEVILEETDIAKAIDNYIVANSIDTLVLGAASRNGIVRRFKTTDVPSSVSKGAPDFCTVYVIAKGKISSVRSASAALPVSRTPIRHQLNQNHRGERTQHSVHPQQEEMEMRSPFTRNKASMNRSYELSPETDISFVSSGRPSMDRMFPAFYDNMEAGMSPRYSNESDFDFLRNVASNLPGNKSVDLTSSHYDFSSSSIESGKSSTSHNVDDVEAEMRRLRLELKQTMDMYSTACKEALTAKQKANELHRWKLEEEQKLEEARLAEEAALALAEKEKVKCRAAMEAAEAAQRIAELEAQRRMNAERKALREAEERRTMGSSLSSHGDIRYRKYTIEEIETATEDFSDRRKIGEGGYGPVYKGELDHTQVAIKVLRPDAAQGRSQFQQEVEVLSCIRHPNMVLLLGACPEFGCLVYEYMAHGSLEDRLFRRGNTAVIPWQVRFRIAAEIGTGLLFLHQTKPEPLVHRDLKPANILLDRNYVSKISDVGLARLVPPSVADSVTQYRMTATAGTFCYIDPEYQQTGMLGIKSDVYSLGVLLLQLITAKPPMGLTHHMERAIEKGNFTEMLDRAITDWPLDVALQFAKLALQCAEMRKKDRPDLGKVVLPHLNRWRDMAEDNMPDLNYGFSPGSSSSSKPSSISSLPPDVLSDSLRHSDESSRSPSSSTPSTEGS